MNDLNAIERNRETVKTFLDGTHASDIEEVEIIDRTVSPDIVCHGFPGFPGGEFADRESYKNFFRLFRQSFSDMRFTLHALVADEQYVAARWQVEATHSGEYAGRAAEGRRVDFDGLVLYRMDDGLIAETWLQINELSLLGQIGALPKSAAA